MTMVSPGPGQFIFRLKFAQLTDYFAQITSKRILSPFSHVNLNITNNYWSNWFLKKEISMEIKRESQLKT